MEMEMEMEMEWELDSRRIKCSAYITHRERDQRSGTYS